MSMGSVGQCLEAMVFGMLGLLGLMVIYRGCSRSYKSFGKFFKFCESG